MIDVQSSGDRNGQSPNPGCYGTQGVVGVITGTCALNWKNLESFSTEGDRPVQVRCACRDNHLSRAGHVESCLNLRGPSRKAKYSRKTDSEPVL